MTLAQIKQLLCDTGVQLLQAGLVARTWGNISIRIDEKSFAITPSGVFYKDIKVEHISVISIDDLSWTGMTKPSSEKGLHANIYKEHPKINAIIHTHQPAASAIAAARLDLNEDTPCVPYALPTTAKLARKAASLLRSRTEWVNGSILLANHGTICTGSTIEQAVKEALDLENKSVQFIKSYSNKLPRTNDIYSAYHKAQELMSPLREELSKTYSNTEENPEWINKVFAQRPDINTIIWSKWPYTQAYSEMGKKLIPLLDDMAQLIGIEAPYFIDSDHIKIKERNALFIKNKGALCLGPTKSESLAIQMVLEKSARSYIEANIVGKGHPITLFERILMRFIYKTKYSKMSQKQLEKQ
ncbi:class II aldolase/adducin family protein [Spirochaeta cellobiosiphila]|uniref:class II aldolase/adducin family protein n=1 Tax=Spirochaeta cellobiosiphila TaxID=504483 RepID=UPI0004139EC1|nr:class II aldolase/adducin family protein [Spirochaeta cellobiosiphila]